MAVQTTRRLALLGAAAVAAPVPPAAVPLAPVAPSRAHGQTEHEAQLLLWFRNAGPHEQLALTCLLHDLTLGVPVPEAHGRFLQRCEAGQADDAELFALCNTFWAQEAAMDAEYRAEREADEAGNEPASKAATLRQVAMVPAHHDTMWDMGDTPARSLNGLCAKARAVVNMLAENEDGTAGQPQENVALSLARDLLAYGGAA